MSILIVLNFENKQIITYKPNCEVVKPFVVLKLLSWIVGINVIVY